MTTSEQINELAAALSKAQGEIAGASKDSANPFFKSKYADLASVWDACRGPLSKNGLAIVQSPSVDGLRVSLDTLLTHASGQWLSGTVSVSAKEDSPQAVGSCITYLRRYALQSFAGVAPDDDDGEAAHGRSHGQQTQQPKAAVAAVKSPDGYEDWWFGAMASAEKGQDALRKVWEDAPKNYRAFTSATNQKGWEGLKTRAAAADKTLTGVA